MINLAIFVSGSGSNLIAIQNSITEGSMPEHQIRLVFSDRPDCRAVEYARVQRLPYSSFRFLDFANKEAYEEEILRILADSGIELVVLAGYMRLVGPKLLNVWEGRIINLHPSLLPNFPGKDAIGQALVNEGIAD